MTIQASGLQVLELGGLGLGSSRFGFQGFGLRVYSFSTSTFAIRRLDAVLVSTLQYTPSMCCKSLLKNTGPARIT